MLEGTTLRDFVIESLFKKSHLSTQMFYLNAYIWCWMVFDSNGRAFHHLWSLRWNKEFWANKLFIEKQRGGSFLDSKETDFWVLRVFSRFFSTVAICRTSTWTGFTSAWPRWCSSRAPSTPCLSSELSPTDPILLAVTLWSRSLALILSSLWLFILRQITAERQNCGTGSIVGTLSFAYPLINCCNKKLRWAFKFRARSFFWY